MKITRGKVKQPMLYLEAECPRCDSSLLVRVTGKDSMRSITCAACERLFEYFCWCADKLNLVGKAARVGTVSRAVRYGSVFVHLVMAELLN